MHTFRILSCLALAATSSQLALTLDARAAAPVPPSILAPLRADVRAATAELATARARVARQADVHRRAQVDERRTDAGADLAAGVARLVPGFADLAAPFRASARDASARTADSARRLDQLTDDASQLQGQALDAQRRIDALQRAAATSATGPTTAGASYRFGSGRGGAVSAASLDRYLESKASPIAGAGRALLDAGVRHRIDPRLIIAIAGAESYFGLQLCAPFNAWGWGCPNGPVRFQSWDDAAATIARGLRENYLDDGLTTVGEIHLRYAPPNAANDPTNLNYAWADNVARFLVEQGGDPQDVGGPRAPSR